MDYFEEQNVDCVELLSQLKADLEDPIMVHQRILMLQSQLSRSDEKQLGGSFPLTEYIQRLISILGQEVIMDFQIDTKFAIIQCLDFLMDIYPQSVQSMISEGLISTMSSVIQNNMAYTDLADQTAKLFDKPSKEAPAQLLNSPAISTLLLVFDFCEKFTQQKILQIILNVSRHTQSIEIFNERQLPTIEWLAPKLHIDRFLNTSQSVEKVSTALYNIVMSLQNFLSPTKDFDKLAEAFVKLESMGLFGHCIGAIKEFIEAQGPENQQIEAKSPEKIANEDSNMIDTGVILAQETNQNDQQASNMHTERCLSNLLIILQQACHFSPSTIKCILEGEILQTLTRLLPNEKQDSPTYLSEVVSLIQILFPQTEADKQSLEKSSQTGFYFGAHQAIHALSTSNPDQIKKHKEALQNIQDEKNVIFAKLDPKLFNFCATTLLPKLIGIYGKNVAPRFRDKCLSLVNRILAVLPDQLLCEHVDSAQLASIVMLVLSTSGTGPQVLTSLKIVSRVLSSDALRFALPFQREGVSHTIRRLAEDKDNILARYDEEMAASQTEIAQNSSASPFGHLPTRGGVPAGLFGAGGLFGSKSVGAAGGGVGIMPSGSEQQIMLELELRKIREILVQGGALIPPGKRMALEKAIQDKQEFMEKLIKDRLEESQKVLASETAAAFTAKSVPSKDDEKKGAKSDDNHINDDVADDVDMKDEEKKQGGVDSAEESQSKEKSQLISRTIKEEAVKVLANFLDNKEFNLRLQTAHNTEIGQMSYFEQLAQKINQEAVSSAAFDCKATVKLIEEVMDCVCKAGGMTSFEFEASGLLTALETFLTKSPSMARWEIEAKKKYQKDADREEIKNSEELDLQMAQKDAVNQISKSDAQTLLLRLKIFAHALVEEKQGRLPLKELIKQCHAIVSSNEHLIFDNVLGRNDPNQGVSAMSQLGRREIIKVVYDPTGELIEKSRQDMRNMQKEGNNKSLSEKRKDQEQIDQNEYAKKLKQEEEEILLLEQPSLDKKTKSVMVPFSQLSGNKPDMGGMNSCEGEEEFSKVYQKRDRIFKVIKQISADVQHSDSLWLLEEKILKIDSLARARDYENAERYLQRGFLNKSVEEIENITQRFENMNVVELFEEMENVGNRIDKMLDEATSQEHFETLKPTFVAEISQNVKQIALDQDACDEDIDCFFEMALLDCEEKISEHEQEDGEEMSVEDLRNEHVKALIVLKMRAFGQMIRETASKTKELIQAAKNNDNQSKKEEEGKHNEEDSEMVDSSKEKDVSKQQKKEENEEQEELKDQGKDMKGDNKLLTTQPEVRAQFSEPPNIGAAHSKSPTAEDCAVNNSQNQQALISAGKKEALIVEAKILSESSMENVEMTDENASKSDAADSLEISNQSSSILQSSLKKVEDGAALQKKSKDQNQSKLSEVGTIDKHPIDSFELEKLLRQNNGQDVHLEFYLNGHLVPAETSFFEIWQMAQKQIREAKNDEIKEDKKNTAEDLKPSNFVKQMFSSADLDDKNAITLYFKLVDNNAQAQVNRKDSIVEAARQRQRTLSQANNQLQIQSLNQLVQELIDYEFAVFIDKIASNDRKKSLKKSLPENPNNSRLEEALKVLKVLHFLVSKSHMLSEKGINFLLETSSSQRLLSDFNSASQDLETKMYGLDTLFFLPKLDGNMLKSIQDPGKLVTGGLTGILKQIFSSCSFLFQFETKTLYFKLVSFLGVDVNRSLAYLRSYQRKRLSGQDANRAGNGGPGSRDRDGINRSDFLQKVEIERSDLLNEALKLKESLIKRKQLEVKYKNEVGTGLGPTLEFYTNLAEALKGAKDGKLWRQGLPNNTLYPKPIDSKLMDESDVRQICELFQVAGCFVAKSIVDDRQIDLPISSLMWDLILGKKLNLFDLRDYDANQFKLLSELQVISNKKRQIQDNQNMDIEAKAKQISEIRTTMNTSVADLGLYFLLPGDEQIELFVGGKDKLLTIENVQEYIDLVLYSIFHDSVSLQIHSFKKGFNQILPVDSLRTFGTKEEIERLICGIDLPDADWQDKQQLMSVIKADHGFTQTSQAYKDFIRFLMEMEAPQRPLFLKWLTGSRRLPLGGFGSLDPLVSVNLKKGSSFAGSDSNQDSVLPSVSTCQHYVKMPEYSSYEVLKRKFEFSITETNSFHMS